MNLLQRAKNDLNKILSSDFAQEIEIKSPAGIIYNATGNYMQVALDIDPETGTPVSGSRASVSIPLEQFVNLQIEIPKRILGNDQKPWIIKTVDSLGISRSYTVVDSLPDQMIQNLVLILELFEDEDGTEN